MLKNTLDAASVMLLATSFSMPVTAASPVHPPPPGLVGQSDVVTVADNKRNKRRQVLRHPRNGDILVGPVEGFRDPDWKNARRVREGDDLGGLIGQAVNNFMGGGVHSGGGLTGRATGRHEVPAGAYGQTCGPQYGTSTPTSPAC